MHNGHLIIARAVAEHCGFDKITFVPAGNRPHKQSAAASAEHRMQMLRLAIAAEDIFDISQVEINRIGPSYTVDTLTYFRKHYSDNVRINWLVGADMLADLPNWHRADEILRLADIITAVRSPQEYQLENVFAQLSETFEPQCVKSLRENVVPTPVIDISASQIRRRISDGMSIHYLTPEIVCNYIKKHNLYKEENYPTQ